MFSTISVPLQNIYKKVLIRFFREIVMLAANRSLNQPLNNGNMKKCPTKKCPNEKMPGRKMPERKNVQTKKFPDEKMFQ